MQEKIMIIFKLYAVFCVYKLCINKIKYLWELRHLLVYDECPDMKS
jgi:hypothetical protein